MSRPLLGLAAFLAFCVISLRVPVDARDLGYYLNGAVLIGSLSFLAFAREDSNAGS